MKHFLVLVFVLAFAARADSLDAKFAGQLCVHALAPAAADSPDYRKYAPDRRVDILHLKLEVIPNFQRSAVAGAMTLTFKPIAKPLDELRLNGVDLTVSEVTGSARIASHQVTDKEVIITFAKPVPVGAETKVTVLYSAQPRKGLYFRTAREGYRESDAHLWSQGEADEARHWFPCYDYPNAKFTSEITCSVPEGMMVLSNGRKVSETKDAKTGLVAVRWVQEKPHVSYLMALCAGHFEKVADQHGAVALEFYTPPSDIAEAGNSLRGTRDMMAFFERETGVAYPWAEYKQVVVHDFLMGGMENTTMTVLTDRTLHRTNMEQFGTSEGLVAHELAHQWFGDLVTCKDWSHLWLNEGFATFYAHLYAEHAHGRDRKLYGLLADLRNITSQTNDTRGIVWRKYGDPQEMFNYLAYPKGSWVLHMLRSQLGEDLYRRCITTYLERHRFGSVTTDDLLKVVEEMSGRSFDQFFEQWVYRAQQPVLDVNYSWDAKTKLAKVSVKQVQKISEDISLFRFPLTLRFKSKGATTDKTFEVREREHDFFVVLKDAPEIVRVDPEFTLLAKVNFKPPNAMLHAQLADKSDMIGRVLAAEQLGEKSDSAGIAKLKDALQHDAFFGVRIECAKALKKTHTDEARDALLASLAQPDAQARNAVVEGLAGFFDPKARDALLRVAKTEKNPVVAASAVRSLGKYADAETRAALRAALASDSYRQRLADAAIGAIREQDQSSSLELLRETVQSRGNEFSSSSLAGALDAFASVARPLTDKSAPREFLKSRLTDKKERVRVGAIRALGTLGDEAAIPLLEPFAAGVKDSPEQREAESALAKLRGGQKPGDNLKDLRKDLLDVKDENRKLRKDLDELKKKIEATKP